MTFHLPGNYLSMEYMKEVRKAAKKHSDKAVFMVCNSKLNIEYILDREDSKFYF
jgi:hypothetical protein